MDMRDFFEALLIIFAYFCAMFAVAVVIIEILSKVLGGRRYHEEDEYGENDL